MRFIKSKYSFSYTVILKIKLFLELKELEEELEETPLATEIKRKISRQKSRLSSTSSGNIEHGFSRSMSAISIQSKDKQNGSVIGSKISLQDEEFKNKKGKLIEKEHEEKGNVKLDVFKYYFVAIGFTSLAMTLICYAGFQGIGIESSIWLGHWSDDPNTIVDGQVNTSLRNMYLWVYATLGAGQGIFIFAANIIWARSTIRAAIKLHNLLMSAVMRLPMSFFDVTPTGRILARFSSDIIGVDMRLPGDLNNFFQNVAKVRYNNRFLFQIK